MNILVKKICSKNSLSKVLVVLISMLALHLPMTSYANNISEYKIKAGFIYNFARFTKWPEDLSEIKICVYGRDPFMSYINDLDNKKIGEKTIRVLRTKKIESVKSCQIVFLNIIPPEQRLYRSAIKKIGLSNTLTIADAENVVDFGVMIGLEIENDKVSFRVNLSAAKKSNLEISAKLLRLAKEVI